MTESLHVALEPTQLVSDIDQGGKAPFVNLLRRAEPVLGSRWRSIRLLQIVLDTVKKNPLEHASHHDDGREVRPTPGTALRFLRSKPEDFREARVGDQTREVG
jgi:hypothetical protein